MITQCPYNRSEELHFLKGIDTIAEMLEVIAGLCRARQMPFCIRCGRLEIQDKSFLMDLENLEVAAWFVYWFSSAEELES